MIIKKAEYLISAVGPTGYPQLGRPEFVFMGRSNVGKSSFINAITNRKNLAYTSGKPGKTQTLNFYNINDEFTFVDVPGYGYASCTKEDRIAFGNMIEGYLKYRKELQKVFLIVDIRHEPSKDDVLMYDYLKHFNTSAVVIATKADKIGKTLIERHLKVIKQTLKFNESDRLIAVSSETKYGLDKVDEVFALYQ